jgi:glucokinase
MNAQRDKERASPDMSSGLCIGVDIGGTHMRAALVDVSGKIVLRRKTSTGAWSDPRETCGKLIDQCRSLLEAAARESRKVEAVCLGVAGKIDYERGCVTFSPNLPHIGGYPLLSEVERDLGIPVVIENDANVFGVGESWRGAGRGIANWIGLTLGTGVGGCLILGERLWRGDGLGFAGEIGHMVVHSGGLTCACGLHGCLEAYASASALVNGVKVAHLRGEHLAPVLNDLCVSGKLDAEAVYNCARAGAQPALGLIDRMGETLGLALANLFTVLGIRHAIIGGGVGAAWDLFIGPLRESLAKHSSMLLPDQAIVRRSELGDDAALIGAARLAWQRLNVQTTGNEHRY